MALQQCQLPKMLNLSQLARMPNASWVFSMQMELNQLMKIAENHHPYLQIWFQRINLMLSLDWPCSNKELTEAYKTS